MPSVSMLIKPVSASCNMRCAYCFYTDVANRRNVRNFGVMDDETQENFIKKTLAYAQDSVTFAFQGGEPTLAGIGFYERHLKLCEKYNKNRIKIDNTLQTNGYCVDERWARFFAENDFLIGISLDGPKYIHDAYRKDAAGNSSFNQIRRAVTFFDRAKVNYNILCVVTESTAKNANQVLNFFINGGYRYLQFIPCLDNLDHVRREWSLSPERYGDFLITCFRKYYSCYLKKQFFSVRNFDNYLSMLGGYSAESCAMNGVCATYFVVESNGNVYPCDFYVLDEYCGGNINDVRLSDIKNSVQFQEFIRASLPVSQECRACCWYRLCRGGCRRNREPFVDGSPALNMYCQSYKRFFAECGKQLIDMARSIYT